jgi:hypothetical protein
MKELRDIIVAYEPLAYAGKPVAITGLSLIWYARANASYQISDSEALLLTADRTKMFCKVAIDRTPGRYTRTHNIEIPS